MKEAVFKILQEVILHQSKKDSDKRFLWYQTKVARHGAVEYFGLRILTLALTNEHRTLRMMLGQGIFDDKNYRLQTLRDNLKLFTTDITGRINAEV
ncbi:MAG TPA: ISNCY family transposase, partial [Methyloprofundus sp.]|nr:ISNCY family transposase [Methyloprofundus sp.]